MRRATVITLAFAVFVGGCIADTGATQKPGGLIAYHYRTNDFPVAFSAGYRSPRPSAPTAVGGGPR